MYYFGEKLHVPSMNSDITIFMNFLKNKIFKKFTKMNSNFGYLVIAVI